MDKPKIVIISNGDDWEALYVDGVKKDEGHRLRLDEVLKLLGYPVEKREIDADENFPDTAE